jgi:hypothetical protein
MEEGLLGTCINYWKLNQGTIKDRYPLPLINETLVQLSKAKFVSITDIDNPHTFIRVQDEDIWKTAICSSYGLVESLVMLFRLINASVMFQEFVNKTLCPYLNVLAPHS